MRYPDEHWERVAKLYATGKVTTKDLTGAKTEHSVRVARVQNRFPHATYATVNHWIRKCRDLGLIT